MGARCGNCFGEKLILGSFNICIDDIDIDI